MFADTLLGGSILDKENTLSNQKQVKNHVKNRVALGDLSNQANLNLKGNASGIISKKLPQKTTKSVPKKRLKGDSISTPYEITHLPKNPWHPLGLEEIQLPTAKELMRPIAPFPSLYTKKKIVVD